VQGISRAIDVIAVSLPHRFGVLGIIAILPAVAQVHNAPVSSAATLTTLASFNGTNGAMPWFGSLVHGLDGNFYGTTTYGGVNDNPGCGPPGGVAGCGTVFKITPQGALTSLHSFDLTDGAALYGGLVLATNGYFYGMAGGGPGPLGGCPGWCGTVFRITAKGALTVLHYFNQNDGRDPESTLVQAASGNLYGTTVIGGPSDSGTIFTMTPAGALTTLFAFSPPGGPPNLEGGLVQATDGKFYGLSQRFGTSNHGTVYRVTSEGTRTTLHSFSGADGATPKGTLVQATDGNLYGTTYFGGACNLGTIFRITPGSTFTSLYSFCGADGANPSTGVIQATDGNLYGTTPGGGAYGFGSIYQITTAGVLSTLYSFSGSDGAKPIGGLLQATDGNFYGTTNLGGADGVGTVFQLVSGLGPFVKTLPTSGNVGRAVKILGTNLMGTTSVTFNGIAASFTVTSASLITTTVPLGASTGQVQVATPGGTLSSNVAFRVRP